MAPISAPMTQRDPFEDDQAPFLRPRSFENEHESFIDATADSYHAPKNPFADNIGDGEDGGRTRTQLQKNGRRDPGYDSFDSHDDTADDDESETDDDDDGELSASDYSSDGGLAHRTAYHETADDAMEDDEQDTQRLLLTSTNTRLGGMGMGMRVGETGTGTMIGLDLEPHGTRSFNRRQQSQDQDDDYDTLPLSIVNTRRAHDAIEASKEGIVGRSGRKGEGGRKKKTKKRRGGQLEGERRLGLGAIRSEQIAALAKKQLRVNMFWNAFYVFAWYSCSTALSFYNKWLFSPNHHNFTYPLFTTSLHMVAQFGLSSLTLALLPALRPKAAPSAKDFGTKIMPCAVASGLDIGLSNSSLKTITLAFYTMCKSSSLAFVLLFAFAFKLERPTWTLAGVITVICVGLFMMVMSEVDFVLIGFIQVMLASVLGGLRWSLTQLLLEKTDTKSGSLANPISTIFFLSPIMGICLSIVAGIFEGYSTIFGSVFFSTFSSALSTLGLLFLGGLFAFMMVLAEFNLIARTSVVTLSVLGIIKEVVTIVISSLVFHDQLTIVNILGLFVTLTGIGFYHFMKLREMQAKTRRETKELADVELARAARKKERAKAKKSAAREQQKPEAGKEEAVAVMEAAEQPWNHEVVAASRKDASLHEAFILDDDGDLAHGGR
ncbi:Triose-phosphate Transporter [Gamsiella multidivaricata]|nr:Triose-phosphate Transporter [Gamsiella multidivaricata]